MFDFNDYIIYGESGVCKVADISTPPIQGIDTNCKYYILHPLGTKGRTIYSPVDNVKVAMRKILTREEALKLVERIPYIDAMWISNEKYREDYYKKAIRSNQCEEWIKIIKTIYLRKEERKSEGKALSSTDEKYFKMAEMYLYDELSISLSIPSERVKGFLLSKLEEVEIMKD